MAKWVQIDAKKFNRPVVRHEKGVEIRVGLSPFDVPERVRGEYHRESRRLKITFDYDSEDDDTHDPEEPLVSVEESSGVQLQIGENSGRVYTICIRVAVQGGRVRLGRPRIKSALDQMKSPRKRAFPQYQALEDVVLEHETELLEGAEA